MRSAVAAFALAVGIGGCADASHPPVSLADCGYNTHHVGRDFVRVTYHVRARNDSDKTVKVMRISFGTWAHPTLRDEAVRDENDVLAPHASRTLTFDTSAFRPGTQHQTSPLATSATIGCEVVGLRFADDSVWTSAPGGSAP